ncbi:MAG: hypothetical protein HYV07_13870 [Deltaproteobacteria bacterium]|nr:hypothetical protein [Deltaproteobacteria bacterium]
MAGLISGVLIFGLTFAEPSPPPPEGYCIHCHTQQDERRLAVPTSSIAKSVHAHLEGTCVNCHGGDAREPTKRAHDPRLGFRGKPTTADAPRVCGGCHADAAFIRRFSAKLSVDQLSLYRVSIHGQELERGNLEVATCVSCHRFHDVRHVGDPESPVFPTNVSQTCGGCHGKKGHAATKHSRRNPLEDWSASVHGKAVLEKGDLSAPTCNDCHGDHGASPPGTSDIHLACGQCHSQESAKFMEGPHAEPFDRLGFAQCVECHSNHLVEPASEALLSTTERGVCRKCHKAGTEGAEAAAAMKKILEESRRAADVARTKLMVARTVGLSLPDADVLEAELRTALSRMRVDVHGMEATALDEEAKVVGQLAKRMQASADAATAELELRRKGHVVFVVLVAALVGLILLRIRRLHET